MFNNTEKKRNVKTNVLYDVNFFQKFKPTFCQVFDNIACFDLCSLLSFWLEAKFPNKKEEEEICFKYFILCFHTHTRVLLKGGPVQLCSSPFSFLSLECFCLRLLSKSNKQKDWKDIKRHWRRSTGKYIWKSELSRRHEGTNSNEKNCSFNRSTDLS